MNTMKRRWLGWIASGLLLVTLGVPSVLGQSTEVTRGYSGLPREPDDGSRTAALPYTAATLISLLILVLVCMPARKT
jgi:hypothetical protein